MIVTVFYHADKEQLYDVGKRAGLTGEALQRFKFANELRVDLKVNELGLCEVVRVDGRDVKREEWRLHIREIIESQCRKHRSNSRSEAT